MAVFAMGMCRFGEIAAPTICAVVYRFKVIGIHALANPAKMVKFWRNRSAK